MNTNLKLIKEWIEALRSGKYTQGQSCLRSRGDKFCCLGVLCDITSRKDWEVVVFDEEYSYYSILEEDSVLPESILNLLNLEERTLTFKISSENSKLLEILENYEEEDRVSELGYYDLAQLNDSWELDFSQIADILEEEFIN